MATKTQALKRAASKQKALTAAESAATRLATERGRAVLDAQEAGATYAEMAEVTGLSSSRITQVLAKARTDSDPSA